MALTKAQQVVAAAVTAPEGFGARIDAYAQKLFDAGDGPGLAEFSEALILFSQVLNERAEIERRAKGGQ
jgi:hypothetical protein